MIQRSTSFRIGLTVAALSVACFALSGCGADAKRDAKEIGAGLKKTWNAISNYTAGRKDEAVALFSKAMENAESTLDSAKEKASKLGADAKDSLAARWEDTKNALAAAKDASGDAWDGARDKFDAAWNALQEKIKEVRDK